MVNRFSEPANNTRVRPAGACLRPALRKVRREERHPPSQTHQDVLGILDTGHLASADTYRQTRQKAKALLPGVRYRRHMLFRYSIIWTKPAPAP
jgi:hypothetical protein